jgi:hypothetical protein
MAIQSMRSMTPVFWEMLQNLPGGPIAFLSGLWDQLVGAPLCTKTEPVALNGKTLLVSVSSAPWQRTLEKMSDLLIHRINDCCGAQCVERVIYQVAPIARAAQPPVRHKGSSASNLPESNLAPDAGSKEPSSSEIDEAIRRMVSRYL